MRSPLRRAAVAATALLTTALLLPATSASAAPAYRVGTGAEAYGAWFANPDANPPGVNTGCTPSPAHPRPVVVLEGTTSRTVHSFYRLGPTLANAGYCVYGLNYGETQLTTATNGVVGAMGDIARSAGQLRTFVNDVLARTGSSKVDIVGWSQGGGPMPRYYIQNLGGAAKVNHLVGLSPSNYGTSFFGVLTLATTLERLGNVPFLDYVGAPAFEQQLAGGPFISALNRNGDTRAGVKYTVIQTRYDDVVTPYTGAFLRGEGARNIVLQRACPLDATDHLGIPFDDNAIQYVLNALGKDDPNFRPQCKPAVALVGTPG
ncbi:lipase family alpha/beta hydrolase [Jatrophihabitans fulvus]